MEQSIFTYCYKRYDETGGGWGFYSYSKGMEKYFEENPELKKIAGGFSYEAPHNNEVWLNLNITDYDKDIENERLAIEQYHPEKFAYRSVDINGRQLAVFTYARNLGREITAENRPSNKVIYTLAGELSETEDYPCFYCGVKSFEGMTRKFFKQSNREQLAPVLPSVKAETGGIITREKIHDFLNEDSGREEILIKLFYSLIKERTEKKRPILICDQKENIIYWISALTLLFPKKTAEKIFFSTYDFLGNNIGEAEFPENIQICGVYSPTINDSEESEATNYDISKLEKNEDIVIFDFECGIFPEVQTDEFEEVIRSFCRGDENPLIEYEKYISESTGYNDFDESYTKFYPAGSIRTELFEYYKSDVQKQMFEECYPFLFDLNSKSDELESAVKITRFAFGLGLISKQNIFDDIFTFSVERIKDSSEDFSRLQILEPVQLLTGYTINKTLKTIINQHKEEWINYIVSSGNISNEKVIYILSLFDPYNQDEYEIIAKLSERLYETDELSGAIEKWLEDKFNTSNPEKKPSEFLKILDLSKGSGDCIKKAVKYFLIWEREYKHKFLKLIDSSLSAGVFLNELEKILWKSSQPFFNVYEILNCLIEYKNSYSGEWYNNFFNRLSETSVSEQKPVMEKLLQNPGYSYSQKHAQIIRNIFYKYDFETAEDLAVFSYILCCKISMVNGFEYPLRWIKDSVKQNEYSKREWKKAVEAVPDFNYPVGIEKEVKKVLSERILSLLESDKDENSEKKNIIKNLFKKKK